MTLDDKINLAEAIQSNINKHIQDIWPGFMYYPFILYDAKGQVAVGRDWPGHFEHVRGDIWVKHGADPQFFANTVILHHGRPVAIWDMRTWVAELDIASASASIPMKCFMFINTI